MRRLASHYLLTPGGFLPHGIVSVDDRGVIRDISVPGSLDREAGVEFYPGILIPGFVNAHCHLELSHLHGAVPPGGGLTAFAKGMRTARSNELEIQNEALKIDAAKYWDARMWSEGVSVVGDICNGSLTFELKRRSRIKYHNFCELFGLNADPGKVFALRDRACDMDLQASVTPHSTYSLNREPFQLSTLTAFPSFVSLPSGQARCLPRRFNFRLSIHFLESEEETELFKKRGAMWDWYAGQGFAPDFPDYGSPAERLVAQIPPDRSVMLVHNCRLTQRDIEIVTEHFTAPVTWVVCPGSNRYIAGLVPPVGLLRKNGLQIAVGTDSLASNETLSMVRELSMIGDIPLEELLSWATLGGAKALGMDDTSGSIEVGKSPGLAVLSGIDFGKMALTENSRAERII